MAGPVQSQPARAEVLNADWLSLRETKHADWLAGSRGGGRMAGERERRNWFIMEPGLREDPGGGGVGGGG